MSLASIEKREDGRYLKIINPATLEEVGEYRAAEPEDLAKMIEAARAAQPRWGETALRFRARIFKNVRLWLVDGIDQAAELISSETGKPRREAMAADVIPALDTLEYLSAEGAEILDDEPIPLRARYMRISSRIVYEPLGVIGIISPWNYPFSIPFTEVAAALFAGNAVVLKPSEHTPGVAELVKEAFVKGGGIDPDLIQTAFGDGAAGAALSDSDVDKIVFTGSAATGRKVMAASAEKVRPVILELGGSDPMIVLPDADLGLAADGAVWGRFTNAGQTCAAVKRLLVHRDIHDKFLNMVAERTGRLVVGPDKNYDVDIGPVISDAARKLLSAQLEDALGKGAKKVCGGGPINSKQGFFFAPTILTEVTTDMAVWREETFGPLLAVVPFGSDAEAIKLANDSDYGLSASVWSVDIAHAEKIAARLDAGTVTINNGLYTFGIAETPWGGFKQSGIGKTHAREGLREFTRAKHINIDNLFNFTKPWWYPYSTGKQSYDHFRSLLETLYGKKNLGKGVAALVNSFLEITGRRKRPRPPGGQCAAGE